MKTPFYGWTVTGCAFVVLFLTYGVQYSFGVFLAAMVDDLGWQRASLGGAFSVYSLVYTGLSGASGKLTDRLGPRRVIGLGGVLLGAGLAATSQLRSLWELYLWYGGVAALGMSTAYIPCNTTVVRWFIRKRGLALGIASCGASLGILAMPLVSSAIVAGAGWRTGLLSLGALLLVLVATASRFMVRGPEEKGLLPDGARPAAKLSPCSRQELRNEAPAATPDFRPREARRTFSFWLLLIAFAITLTTVTVPFVHVPAFARDLGLSAATGASAVSVMGLLALAGSILLGGASDRIGRKRAIVIGLSAKVVGFLLLARATGPSALFAGAAAFGFFYGAIASLFPALVGDLFGRAHAGAITGFLFAGAGVIGAWGPVIAGYLRDRDGDYRLAFTLSAVNALTALLLFALLPRPRRVDPPARA